MEDMRDSKSLGRNTVRVQISLPVLRLPEALVGVQQPRPKLRYASESGRGLSPMLL